MLTMTSQATTTFSSPLHSSNPLLSNQNHSPSSSITITPAKSSSGAFRNATLLPSPTESAAATRPNSLILNHNDPGAFHPHPHHHPHHLHNIHHNPNHTVMFTGGTPSQSVHSFPGNSSTINNNNNDSLPSTFRPPLSRMPSIPTAGGGGHDANFWQMLFDVRSRSLARAKLKQSSQVSALLSGFALVAMVEMDVPQQVPVPLLLLFIVATTLLVSVHMIALMISTCILPHVESINCMEDRAASYGLINMGEQNSTNFGDAIGGGAGGGGGGGALGGIGIGGASQMGAHLSRGGSVLGRHSNSHRPNGIPSWSPYEKMSFYIDIAWTCSTVIGIFLFIIELAFIVWVKFWRVDGGYYIAIASSVILLPVLISLIFFAFHFYQKLVSIRYEFTDKVLNELNALADGLA